MKKFFSKTGCVCFIFILVFSMSITSFGSTIPSDEYNLNNSDFVEKDLATENIEYIKADELPLTRGMSDVQPAFEGIGIPFQRVSRSIIGTDERWQVSNSQMNSFPYRGICYLITTWPNGTRTVGTGWFFKSNAIVTAGHCAYSDGVWATKIEVYPGKIGISNPYGGASSTNIGVPTPWVQNGDSTMDYALVKLNAALGNSVGWFGYSYSKIPLLNRITVAGYPADKAGQRMWAMSGQISSMDEYRLHYSIDTAGGQSGSPIYDSDNVAIGVHTNGGSLNSGKRIHRDMYNWMVSY